MLNIRENQRVRIFKVEDMGNYSQVKMSSWRKDKRDDTYKYSNWSFVRFVGRAHEKAGDLKEGDKIELKGAGISLEEYKDSDGNRAWPKNPQLVVFNFEWMDAENSGGGFGPPQVEEESSDDEMPF